MYLFNGYILYDGLFVRLSFNKILWDAIGYK